METLGQGSYGYVIKTSSNGKAIARKVMPLANSLSSEALREIACLKLIQNAQDKMKQRCVQVLDVTMGDDFIEIDMEYVQGGNLHDFLQTAHLVSISL
jgi:serine/threonine protein kinase